MIKDSEYQKKLSTFYATKSSRTNPMENMDTPIGTWKYDDTFKTPDGHLVEQLRLLDPKKLMPAEGESLSIEEYRPIYGREADVERYIDWLKAGNTPPPISVVETQSGKLRIIDGHRRWAAALKADTKILAWVSPITKVDRGKYAAWVGLTHELAIKQAQEKGESVPEEVLNE